MNHWILVPTLLCLSAGLLQAAIKPNILVIVSDDQGYADVGFNGSKDIPTPHLDALAKSGVRCTSGYVTHPFCDLATDLAETRDLAAARPDVLARLTAKLDAWDKELAPPAFLGSSVKNEDWGPGGANQKTNPNAVKKKASSEK